MKKQKEKSPFEYHFNKKEMLRIDEFIHWMIFDKKIAAFSFDFDKNDATIRYFQEYKKGDKQNT